MFTGGKRFSKDEKEEYLRNCDILFDKSAPEESKNEARDYLLEQLKIDAYNALKTYASSNYTKQKIEDSLRLIFDSIERNEKESHIRIVNVVSVQCAILFTVIHYSPYYKYHKDSVSDNVILELQNNILFKDIDVQDYENSDWRIFKNIRYNFCKDVDGTRINQVVVEQPKILITIIENMTVTEIVEHFLSKHYLSGMIYKTKMVDAIDYNPVEFIEHDILHMNTMIKSRLHYDSLYSFSKSRNLSPNEQYKFNIILFLLIHEDGFNSEYEKLSEHEKLRPKNNPFERIINDIEINEEDNSYLRSRLLDDTDLGLLTPRKYRSDSKKRREYIESAVLLFKNILNNFEKKKLSRERKSMTSEDRTTRTNKSTQTVSKIKANLKIFLNYIEKYGKSQHQSLTRRRRYQKSIRVTKSLPRFSSQSQSHRKSRNIRSI